MWSAACASGRKKEMKTIKPPRVCTPKRTGKEFVLPRAVRQRCVDWNFVAAKKKKTSPERRLSSNFFPGYLSVSKPQAKERRRKSVACLVVHPFACSSARCRFSQNGTKIATFQRKPVLSAQAALCEQRNFQPMHRADTRTPEFQKTIPNFDTWLAANQVRRSLL